MNDSWARQRWLTREEWRALVSRSDTSGLITVGSIWAGIAGLLAAAHLLPNPLVIASVVVLLGGRQLALAVAMHEAAHRTLARSGKLNDALGQWFAAAPVLQSLPRYRAHHMRHHKYVGTERDPDIGLASGFPVARASATRKLLRDLTGVTGIKAIIGSLLMLAGWAEYDVSGRFRRRNPPGSSLASAARWAITGLGPALLANATLLTVLLLLDAAWLYILWIAAYATSHQLYLRIRSIAEHAMTEGPTDPFTQARTTKAGWLARALFAPLNVNFHLEHHLLPAVPHFRLPELHRILRARGAYERKDVAYAGSYSAVLAMAVKD